MRLNKVLRIVLILVMGVVFAFGKGEEININFKNLEIVDLIKIVSKILDKNILMDQDVSGKVDFVSNKPVDKEDVLNILMYTLEPKGFTIVDNNGILRLVRINDASKYNLPVVSKTIETFQIITEVFIVPNVNVDVISSKIRHLISTSAKLVTDKDSNAIIITDFVANIKTIKSVIDLLSVDAKKYIEDVKLKNLQAADIQPELVTMAKTIYNEQVENEKVAILLNKDTNSLMFVGKEENVKYLVNYLRDVDNNGSLVAKTVEVMTLKNAEAKAVVTMISGIIANKQYKNPNDKPYASSDEESNSVILMGQKDELEYYKDLITQLDTDRQQVYVQARIIEVSENKTRDVGIKYGIDGFQTGSSGLAMASSKLNGGSSVLDKVGSIGNLDLTTMKSGLALGMTVNLLNQNGAADIVSEPSLLCINNKQSSIYVGETRSIKTGTTTTTGGNISDNFVREDIGLTLKVKPRISNGDKVALEINTKMEDVGQTTTNGQPNTTKKDITTTAIVNNGESIILGGYIKEKNEKTVDKIPLLGDIPFFGALFRNTKEINDKINLVVIITPYIVPKTKDLTYVRNQLSELKILEDKYTKDAILRLEKMKLKTDKENIETDKQLLELEDDKVDVKEDRVDFELDKKEYFDDKKKVEEEKLQKILEKQQELEDERIEKQKEALEKQKELEEEKLKEEEKAKADAKAKLEEATSKTKSVQETK
ncbi:MAG: secretin N-terminal domain-containing protein [Arcobacteraceae bacterium]|nr:secretin N-terminal domain-containing protein [Arcobacteraceae bacterium]